MNNATSTTQAITAIESHASTLDRRQMLVGTTAIAVGATTSAPTPAQAEPPLAGISNLFDRAGTGPSIHKQRAISDYQANMHPLGGSLASPIDELFHAPERNGPYQFDVLIIGSGYGGAVCAARLSQSLRSDRTLCVMERGREWVPGTFPDTRANAAEQARFDLVGLQKNKIKNPLGLFSSASFEEINVLTGNGLGGGSLINANVAYRPELAAFSEGRWPAALANRAALDPYYDRAEWELDVSTEPLDITPKMRLERLAAERLQSCGASFEPARISITRGDCGPLPIINRQGLRQRACINCGDCTAGCNVGSKHTLAMNYLPLARRQGAKIFTQCEVDHVEKCAGFYRVHYKYFHGNPVNPHRHSRGCVTARLVILGAGSLGSTEILLRSQSPRFAFSSQLGCSWSANGDAIGFIRKIGELTNIGGQGAYPTNKPPVGPTIQTNITYPARERLKQRVLLQDGSIARAYANVLGSVLGDLDLTSTMLIFAMGFDDGIGRIMLDQNGLATVRWPGLENSPYRHFVQQEFERLAGAMGGNYKVMKIFGDNLVTVHPLGGCNLADDAATGVVNDRGQVFDPAATGYATESGTHQGLYVADGSIIPSAIGVNPFMTIAALSERIAEHIKLSPEHADLFAA